jgi:hypothetical protein
MEDNSKIKFFCLEHKRSVPAQAGVAVFCEEGEAHEIARGFPHKDYWEYCCDCARCYSFQPARKLMEDKGSDNESCLACGRSSIRRFLCSSCKVISLKSRDKVPSALFSITATGAIRPYCPGCLTKVSAPLREHDCRILGLGFTTTQESCPFCKEAVPLDPHHAGAFAAATGEASSTLAASSTLEAAGASAESGTQSPTRLLLLAKENGHPPVQENGDAAQHLDAGQPAAGDEAAATEKAAAPDPLASRFWMVRLYVASVVLLHQKWARYGALALGVATFASLLFATPIWDKVRARVFNSRPFIKMVRPEKTKVNVGGSVTLTATAKDPNGDDLTYEWYSPRGKIEGDKDTATIVLNLADVQPGDSFKVRVFAKDVDAVSDPLDTEEIHVVSPENHDPELSPIRADKAQVVSGERVMLTTSVRDQDGDIPTYEWSCSSGWFEGNNTNGPAVVLNTTGINVLSSSASITVTVTVRDGHGGHDTKYTPISIVPPRESKTTSPGASPTPAQTASANDKLQVVISPPERLTITAGESLRLMGSASNPDGDDLKYEWHLGSTNARIDGGGPDVMLNTSGLVTLIAPLRLSVTLIVKNWHGKSGFDQIHVEVLPSDARKPMPPVPSTHPEPTPAPTPEAKSSGGERGKAAGTSERLPG